jgi:membrane protease subunit HflK
MLTGDESVVELNATVQYRIADVRQFLFGVNEPEKVLRATAESVLRTQAAAVGEDHLLTSGRRQFETAALAAIARRVGPDGYGLGIEVLGVALRDVHPPLDVVRDYHNVSAAMEEKEQLINVADAYRESAVRMARSEALATERQAQGIAERQVKTAAASRYGYLARQAAYASAPELTAFRLFWESLEMVLAGRPKIVLDPAASKHQRILLSDGQALNLPSLPTMIQPPAGSEPEGPEQ